jgi:hypothetical protein
MIKSECLVNERSKIQQTFENYFFSQRAFAEKLIWLYAGTGSRFLILPCRQKFFVVEQSKIQSTLKNYFFLIELSRIINLV